MKAIVFDGKLNYVEDYPVPQPEKGEALIRVILAGICNTDIEIMNGYLGFQGVIGHEFVGIVERTDSDDNSLIGKKVVGEINCGCGSCEYCIRDLQRHCPDRKTVGIAGKDGAFAEYISLPLNNLLEIPENVSDREAVFTEPLAAAFEILEQIHIKPIDRILILGDGKLGILAALVLSLDRADVTLAGKHENKLQIAEKQHVKTINFCELKTTEKYDVVIEATGSEDGFNLALGLTKPRGVIVLKTTVAHGKLMNLAPVVIDEIQIVGSRCGRFEPALRSLRNKFIDVKPLITATYRAEDFTTAFSKAREKESLKVLLDFS